MDIKKENTSFIAPLVIYDCKSGAE